MNVLMIGTGDIAYSHGRAVVKLGGKVYAAAIAGIFFCRANKAHRRFAGQNRYVADCKSHL